MYNGLILLVHKLVHCHSARQQINIMLSHGLINAIAVTDLIDGVNNAIDVQVAKTNLISSKKL
jgi:hypothetical protein